MKSIIDIFYHEISAKLILQQPFTQWDSRKSKLGTNQTVS